MFRRLLPRAKRPRKSASRRRFSQLSIESLEERRLLAVVTVSNTTDDIDGDVTSIAALIADPGTDGGISLREAILAANHTPNVGGPDEIDFAISGTGVQTIMVFGFAIGVGLPAITDPVVINGFTQTGSAANTNPTTQAINATPLIDLDGSSTFPGENGLVISAGGAGSTIRGLVIHNFGGNGIFVDGADNNIIAGNFIGTDPTGTMDGGNRESGVNVDSGNNNRIGGTAAADRNLISSNGTFGITIDDDSDSNQVLGNFIGTTIGGDAALGNFLSGIVVQFGSGLNTIGGTSLEARNLISANGQAGIEIRDVMSDGNRVQGNAIGTKVDGTGDLGNSGDGVVIYNGTLNNLIGGTDPGAGNLIAFNNDGVSVVNASTLGNAIRRNSFFNNDDLGIDLNDDGPTLNDAAPPADDDEGPNRLQNKPVFVGGATLLGTSVALRYRVDTDPSNATYPLAIDFYAADSSTEEEGRTFLASDTYPDTDAGMTKFVLLPAAGISSGKIVATATDADGNTSEFSLPVFVTGPVILGSEPTIIREDSVVNGSSDFFQYRAHSTGKLSVRIDFIHEFGDLDLEVTDQFGNLLAPTAMSSSPSQNFEEIIIPVVAQQRYFFRVFGNGLNSEIPTPYSLEVENFAAPVPTNVHLDPASDTGRLNNDNRTNDNTPTFFISDDVLNFVDTNNTGLFEDPDDMMIANPDAIDALTPAEAGMPGASVEVTLVNTSIPSLPPIIGLATPLSAAFPTTYVFTVPDASALPDGVYLVTADTRIWDGQGDAIGDPAPATGRSNMSPSLLVVVDTMKPNVVFGEEAIATDGIDPASDTGVPSQPATIVDRITSDSTPTLWGTAEANATVRVFVLNALGARVLIGETVATPFGGNNPNASGRWSLTSQIDMNDPLLGFAALDGVRQFQVEAEDVAGNLSSGAVFKSIVGQTIPDDQMPHDFTFNVSGLAGRISDLNVTLNILHSFDSDLDVTLISPNMTAVHLFMNIGGAGQNFISTTLDDEATTPIAMGTAPFTGNFVPLEALSAFDGQDPNGTWTLRITDDTARDVGTLLDWTLCFQQTLSAFIDTQGPRVAAVGDGTFDLLAAKPQATGPTPALHQLKISFVDQPVRDAAFLPYPAVNQIQAEVPGNYRLVGDRVGIIPIVDVIFADHTVAGMPGMSDVTLVFGSVLPDDHYTLTVSDNLRDNAGNRLDGEFAGHPAPLPSGDGVPGGDFVVQFTTDGLPELGVWAAGTVLIDANGNFISDGGFAGGDLAFHLGFSSDYIIAGNFMQPEDGEDGHAADGFDKLAAYGRVGNQFRWLIDFTNDGVPDAAFNEANINGIPLAGNFDGNAANGDEVGLFAGQTWYFDTDHDFTAGDNASLTAGYQGFPFAGDFDGDGDTDVGTYIASQAGGNLFSIDINTAGAGNPIHVDGVADYTFRVGLPGLGSPAGFTGFPGVRERPVAADMNGDGVDDIGLWVPDGTALVPGDKGEWFFLVSNNDPNTAAVENTVLSRISGGFVSFTPTPFGQDIYAQFGNSFALPVVGNFDPPHTALAAPVTAAPPASTSSVSTNESTAQLAAAVAAASAAATNSSAPVVAANVVSTNVATSAAAQAPVVASAATPVKTSKVARNKSNQAAATAVHAFVAPQPAIVTAAPAAAVKKTSAAIVAAPVVSTPAPMASASTVVAAAPPVASASIVVAPVTSSKKTSTVATAIAPTTNSNVVVAAATSAPAIVAQAVTNPPVASASLSKATKAAKVVQPATTAVAAQLQSAVVAAPTAAQVSVLANYGAVTTLTATKAARQNSTPQVAATPQQAAVVDAVFANSAANNNSASGTATSSTGAGQQGSKRGGEGAALDEVFAVL